LGVRMMTKVKSLSHAFIIEFVVVSMAMGLGAALAQQQPAPPSPNEQALGQKLMAEINASIACGANLITANQALATAQARIKELEDKLAKSEPPK
jgi:hypothetical protein